MSAHKLDMRGRACPAPIIELMRVVRGIRHGDTVEVLANDLAFPADVTAWCRKTGNALLRLDAEGDTHVALIRKGQAQA